MLRRYAVTAAVTAVTAVTGTTIAAAPADAVPARVAPVQVSAASVAPAYVAATRAVTAEVLAVRTAAQAPRMQRASIARTSIARARARRARAARSRLLRARIITLAKRYVGFRYTWGGSSPRTGFDCSGFVLYVYRRAHVARLPHNSEAQRRMRHMRRLTARGVRAGDLVFYMSGGTSYHVGIYAGHGWSYAAVDTQSGVRMQKVYTRSVQYRTLTH